MKDLSNENIIHVQKEDIEYIQFRKLLKYREIAHCYTLKKLDFGFHQNVGKYMENVKTSYDKICKEIGIQRKDIVRPIQTHTNHVMVVENKVNKDEMDICLNRYQDIDGVITNKSKLGLSTTNADCILFLFYDPVKQVIANAHSGWKGTFSKIAVEVIKKMEETYHSDPRDIICCMSPSIRKCHFEVDDDVKELCENIFQYTNRLDEIIKVGRIVEGKQKYLIDTILINQILLEDMGIKTENIIDSKICSVCEPERIHSKRASGTNTWGLGTAIIELR